MEFKLNFCNSFVIFVVMFCFNILFRNCQKLYCFLSLTKSFYIKGLNNPDNLILNDQAINRYCICLFNMSSLLKSFIRLSLIMIRYKINIRYTIKYVYLSCNCYGLKYTMNATKCVNVVTFSINCVMHSCRKGLTFAK